MDNLATVPAPARTRRRINRAWRQNALGFAFLLPALAVYLVFTAYPLFQSLRLSLTSWDGVNAVKEFVGLDNYVRALSLDETFRNALYHNLLWITIGSVLPITIGLITALLIYDGVVLSIVFRTVLFMPYVLSSMVIGIIFGLILNPSFGVLNQGLKAVGLSVLAQPWLGQSSTALLSLMMVATWHNFGFNMTLLLAGLQNTDPLLHDAAKIDGANVFQRLWHVTIPQLNHVITLAFSLALIGGFKVFDLVYVMTEGGPGFHTEVLASYIVKQSFRQSYVGYGCALAIMLTCMILIVSVVFIRLRERGN